MKILEYNVDDLGHGGVFALVKSVVKEKPKEIQIDIAAVEHFVEKQNIKNLQNEGCRVFEIGREGSKVIKQIFCARNLYKLLKAEEYDCIHVHGDVANKLLIAALVSRFYGVKKIVLHSHASGVDGSNRLLKKFFHSSTRWLLRFLGTDYVACSRVAADWMFPNVARERVRLIKNGVQLDRFGFDENLRHLKRTELALAGKVVVGHVGRFAYQKNHEFLLRCFNMICNRHENVALLLVGEGEGENHSKEYVEKNGLKDKVIFYGVTDNVGPLMMAMDVFFLPSHFEGLPIAGVEAQASGLPCAFSDKITREANILDTTVSIPICEGCESKWADFFEAVVKNQEKYDRSKAIEVVKRSGFSIESTIADFMNVYSN
ncbi:MAG: glycosyltransferase [Bacteroidales bacterium]|nr:glycosyltransferase [Bacteroidales bacterium]